MFRDGYHQSVGNPLQRDHLPDTLPDTEFAVPDPPPGRITALFGFTAVVLLLVWFLGRLANWPIAPESSVVWGAIVLFFFLTLRLTQRAYTMVQLIVLGVLVLSWTQFAPVPHGIWRTAAAVPLGLLAADLMTYWGLVCTCSPIPRPDRESFRKRWRGYALVTQFTLPVASLAPPFVPMAHAFETFLVAWGLVSVLHAVRVSNPRTCWRVAHSVWRSWLSYNPGRLDAPGVLQVRLRRFSLRVILLIACTYLVAHAHSTSPDRGVWFFDLVIDAAIVFVLPMMLALPVLVDADRYRAEPAVPEEWERIVRGIHASADPIERDSLFLGRVVSDGSPVLVPRAVFREHAHVLGDSGSGKTSLGLLPFLEQMVAFGDCSVVVLDMKGDSGELLATLQSAADRAQNRTGRIMPVKHFTNRSDRSTFAFNPLTQPFWDHLDPYVRTDLLTNALGLNYGTDYGAGYFSSANAAVLHHVLTKYPDARTFRELAERTGHALATASKRDLRPEVRTAGGHVQMILDRLGSFDALNVGPNEDAPDHVRANTIDFTAPFRDPQIIYFHLSATLAPGTAPEIGRLAIASLIAAAAESVHRRQVYLVIDEFQRVVAHNLETLLQLARSLNIGVILANQTMQDLKTPGLDLIPSLESNCRLRQWFAVSSTADRKRLSEGSGQTVELKGSFDYGLLRPEWSWLWKLIWPSASVTEELKPRLSENDVMLVTDHPNRSILTITRGSGYAQYGGLPVVIESHFHIPEEEYRRRRMLPWPGAGNGAFVPRDERAKQPPKPPRKPGPVVTGEVIGDDDPLAGLDDLFDLPGSTPPRTSPRRKELDS
jgi:TraM recognition site of TraD and TraG